MTARPPVPQVWTDDERVAVAVLAGLANMTTARLRWLVGDRSPVDALDVAAGSVADDTPDRSGPPATSRGRRGLVG